MNNDRKKITIFLSVLLTIIVVIGTSYALWRLTYLQDDNNLVKSGCFKINYSDKNSINLSEAYPIEDKVGQKLIPYEFTLTNICDSMASYNINLEVLNDTSVDYAKFIKVQFEDKSPQLLNVYEVVTPTLSNAVKSYTLSNGVLEFNQSLTFYLRLWIDEDASIENAYEKIFNSKITVSTSYVPNIDDGEEDESNENLLYNIVKNQAVLDNKSSAFVTSDTGINFGEAPSDTNGEGVYTIASTKDYEYPVHYFRCEVFDNNVKFANFCWKIVRTTTTGGVKLVYNGTPNENGQCVSTTEASTLIGTSAFNSSNTSLADVGYMYMPGYSRLSATLGANNWYNYVGKTSNSHRFYLF